MNYTWTTETEQLLLDLYEIKGANYCAEKLNRSIDSVYKKANRLGLKAPNNKSKMTHEQYEEKLFNKEIDYYPTEPYLGFATPINHECLQGHTWKAKPSYILSKMSACPICAYNNNQPTILYYIKITTIIGEVFYKIGITNQTVKRRFDRDCDKRIEIIWEHTYQTRSEARAVEYELLTLFKDKLLPNCNILKSGGNTELFSEDILADT
jgi:hypothetical protein